MDTGRQEAYVVRIPWSDFRPTYRGRPKADAGKLDTAHIKRFSFMMRSFFDSQHGPFELFIEELAAFESSRKGLDAEQSVGWLSSLGKCLGWRL